MDVEAESSELFHLLADSVGLGSADSGDDHMRADPSLNLRSQPPITTRTSHLNAVPITNTTESATDNEAKVIVISSSIL